MDREDDTVAEVVVSAAAVVLAQESCRDQRFRREAGVRHDGKQIVPTVRRETETEFTHRLQGDPAAQEILARRPAYLGVHQPFVEMLAREPVGRSDILLVAGLAALFLRDGDPGASRELARRLRERDPLALLHVCEHGAPGATPEALVELILRRDGERRGVVLVERAFADEVLACAPEGDAGFLDDADEVDTRPDLRDRLLWNPPGWHVRFLSDFALAQTPYVVSPAT